MKHILYNPRSGEGHAHELADRLRTQNEEQVELVDITAFAGYDAFFAHIDAEDDVILIGGDGTVNHFINDLTDTNIRNSVYYMPSGSGNDFALDVEKSDVTEPFLLNDYIRDLPTVEVNGKVYRFINGTGFGIDGYCCEVGDRMHAEGKTPNYTSIAIKGLLFHYKPTNAVVTVDGVEHHFKKVWLSPTMFGRHYGGGMMPTPEQDRYAVGEDRRLSVMLFHGAGRLRTLMAFPSIFKGEHVGKKMVTILSGREITVKFDSPRAAQVDGETLLGVTEYTARA
ncbi:MAG: diacylglycerol kinase family protein [Clostridia bacterium]|nr:diacylglycerol kinase family protein [Clostridia bacterium]